MGLWCVVVRLKFRGIIQKYLVSQYHSEVCHGISHKYVMVSFGVAWMWLMLGEALRATTRTISCKTFMRTVLLTNLHSKL